MGRIIDSMEWNAKCTPGKPCILTVTGASWPAGGPVVVKPSTASMVRERFGASDIRSALVRILSTAELMLRIKLLVTEKKSGLIRRDSVPRAWPHGRNVTCCRVDFIDRVLWLGEIGKREGNMLFGPVSSSQATAVFVSLYEHLVGSIHYAMLCYSIVGISLLPRLSDNPDAVIVLWRKWLRTIWVLKKDTKMY
jgi:hypothetical protein